MHDAIDKEPDMSLLAIPAFLRRNKGADMQTDENEADKTVSDQHEENALGPVTDGTHYNEGDKVIGTDSAEHVHEKPMEELTLPEAQARLQKMTAKRDALVTAISAYKKYVQKLIGQL